MAQGHEVMPTTWTPMDFFTLILFGSLVPKALAARR